MIPKELVEQAIGTELEKRNLLLVDLSVNNRNKITVVLDARGGVSIDDCSYLTRLIEEVFDRDAEDYELEVTSAGVGQPLKRKEQYAFNVGRTISLLDTEGYKHTGTLIGTDADGIVLEEKVDAKEKGKKKKIVLETGRLSWDQIKTAKIQVSFK